MSIAKNKNLNKLYLFVIFFVMYEFSTYASNDMIMPGMLDVVREFHASIQCVGLSLTVFILGNSLLQLFLGPLSERYGKRRVILIGNFSFLIFTFFLVMSTNITMFMLGRLLQGSGIAFIAMGYALIHENFNDKEAIKICALMGNVSILAPLLGPILGVFIIQMSQWRYVFSITGLIASIAFIGLYLFTPQTSNEKLIKLPLHKIGKQYLTILLTKQFIMGTLCISLATLPVLCWIGLSATIIMQTLKHSMISYAFYQCLAIGGITLSTVVIHIVAGKINFYHLIIIGMLIAFSGLITSLIFHNSLNIATVGMFIYSFGLGILNAMIIRLVMTLPNLPHSLLTSLMVFIQTSIFAIGLEITNHICHYFNYSLYSFTLINFVIGCCFVVLIPIYAKMNKNREWK